MPDRVTLTCGFDTERSYSVQLTARVAQHELNPLSLVVRRVDGRLFNLRLSCKKDQFAQITEQLSKVVGQKGLLTRIGQSLIDKAVRPIAIRLMAVLSPLGDSLTLSSILTELQALANTVGWYSEMLTQMYNNDELFLQTICTTAK